MTRAVPSPGTVLRDAAAAIAQCRDCPPEEGKQVFSRGFRLAVRARNAMMGPLQPPRQPAGAADAAARRNTATLRQLNALLSLMSSIEFPLAGFHRERLDAVTREMQALLREDLQD